MNSAQRRHARREFPHMVEMTALTTEQYYKHDARVDFARVWCRRQFKKNSWRVTAMWDHAVFHFANEKDATFFALKWA